MSLTWGDFRWGRAYFTGEHLPIMVFDRGQIDLDSGTSKAFHNYNDYNRIETATEYIAKSLTDNGYFTTVTVKKDWVQGQITKKADVDRIVANVQKCVNNYCSAGYALPPAMDGINIVTANSLEATLEELAVLVDNMKATYRCIGTFCAGQLDGLRGYNI